MSHDTPRFTTAANCKPAPAHVCAYLGRLINVFTFLSVEANCVETSSAICQASTHNDSINTIWLLFINTYWSTNKIFYKRRMAVNDASSACHLLDAQPLQTQVMLSGAQAPAQLRRARGETYVGAGTLGTKLPVTDADANARLNSAASLRHCALNGSIILYRNST